MDRDFPDQYDNSRYTGQCEPLEPATLKNVAVNQCSQNQNKNSLSKHSDILAGRPCCLCWQKNGGMQSSCSCTTGSRRGHQKAQASSVNCRVSCHLQGTCKNQRDPCEIRWPIAKLPLPKSESRSAMLKETPESDLKQKPKQSKQEKRRRPKPVGTNINREQIKGLPPLPQKYYYLCSNSRDMQGCLERQNGIGERLIQRQQRRLKQLQEQSQHGCRYSCGRKALPQNGARLKQSKLTEEYPKEKQTVLPLLCGQQHTFKRRLQEQCCKCKVQPRKTSLEYEEVSEDTQSSLSQTTEEDSQFIPNPEFNKAETECSVHYIVVATQKEMWEGSAHKSVGIMR